MLSSTKKKCGNHWNNEHLKYTTNQETTSKPQDYDEVANHLVSSEGTRTDEQTWGNCF